MDFETTVRALTTIYFLNHANFIAWWWGWQIKHIICYILQNEHFNNYLYRTVTFNKQDIFLTQWLSKTACGFTFNDLANSNNYKVDEKCLEKWHISCISLFQSVLLTEHNQSIHRITQFHEIYSHHILNAHFVGHISDMQIRQHLTSFEILLSQFKKNFLVDNKGSKDDRWLLIVKAFMVCEIILVWQ